MSKRRCPEQWRALLSAFHRSGKKQVDFCSEHGLSVSSLQYQLRRERSRAIDPKVEDAPSPQLLEVRPMEDRDDRPAKSHPALRIECSVDSPRVAIECPPDQLPELLAGLSTFHTQQGSRR